MYEPSGFIKLHRRLLGWGWYSDPAVKAVFIHILLTASFTGREWQGITLSAGQTVTSIKSLSSQLGLSEKQVRTALGKLKKTGEIITEATNRYTLITVVNWGKYQSAEESAACERHTEGRPSADKGHQYNNYKNKKNYKNASYEEHTSYDMELFEKRAQELPVYVSPHARKN